VSRRVICLEAPDLQPLLRDGANAPPQDENGAVWNRVSQPLCALCAFSAFFAITLQRRRRGGRKDNPCLVLPAQAGIQGHRHQIHLPPWTPDQVRGDEIPANTHPHPEERSVSKGEAQCLQPLLRDGATRLLRMRMGRWNCVCQAAPRPLRLLCVLCDYSSKVGTRRAQRQSLYVLPAKAGIQGHRHQIHLPPWTPDHVRGDEILTNTHPHPEERSVSKGDLPASTVLTAPPSRRRYRASSG